jgi:uncharacterized pyridoxal phosphate-containing UPF0001 family protein
MAANDALATDLVYDKLAKQQLTSDLLGVERLNGSRTVAIARSDSLELAERMARIAAEEGLAPAVLLQVKLRPDPAKGGLSAEELQQLWPRLVDLKPLRLVGLMTIAPLGLDAAARLALFRDCAALADGLGLPERSMGMSQDWPEAVTAGSTWLRLGGVLFGLRSA